MHVLQRVQPLHSTSKIDIDVSSFRCSFPSTVHAHTCHLPAHCTSNRAERQFNQGSNNPRRNPHTNPLPSTFDKSKIMACRTTEDCPRQPLRAAGCEREPLRGNTRHVLDAQGAGSPQATRKRRLASCCGCALLPAWLERPPQKAPMCSQ